MESRLFEYAGAVRGEMRYFAVFDTKFGKLETTIVRSESKGRNSTADTDAWISQFRPDTPKDRSWVFIAGLGYHEIDSRDVPMHGKAEPHMGKFRSDAAKLLERAEAILA